MIEYGGLPEPYSQREQARVAILPVPYDGTSTWGKGADRGPLALLEASTNMELYDIETDSEVYHVGIFTDQPVLEARSPEHMVYAVEQRTAALLDEGKLVATIGGEHSVSIGAIRAHAARFPDLTVLQIDAHADLRDAYEGSPNNHACVMARARELCPIVQVGIRSMDIGEKANLDPQRVFWAHEIVDAADDTWMSKALNLISANVYITIDLDGFDPAIAPSTGTPEPGGLQWYPALRFLRKVIEHRNMVGFDIVELCPNPADRATDFMAAKLLYKLLSYKYMH
ncbi:MAG: agmatinase [Bacteroidales bacterium]|nr:agmatinase [Bacteroidales bacterium]